MKFSEKFRIPKPDFELAWKYYKFDSPESIDLKEVFLDMFKRFSFKCCYFYNSSMKKQCEELPRWWAPGGSWSYCDKHFNMRTKEVIENGKRHYYITWRRLRYKRIYNEIILKHD